jgi:hypothetical protein
MTLPYKVGSTLPPTEEIRSTALKYLTPDLLSEIEIDETTLTMRAGDEMIEGLC